MGAELRVEGEEVVRLAEELAALRKMSLSDAVTDALRQEIARQREVDAKTEGMLALGREIRAHIDGPVSSNHDWLYDEHGLPA